MLLYLYTNTFVLALVLPKRATLHLDPFVTLRPRAVLRAHHIEVEIRALLDNVIHTLEGIVSINTAL